MGDEFAVVPASAGSRRLVIGLGIFLVALAVFLISTRPVWGEALAALAVLAGAGLLFHMAGSMRHVTVVLSPHTLRVRGDLFGRTIPRAALRVEEARLMSLTTDAAHQPILRTCGTGLPGYLTGWFRLRNREKALVFLTEQSRVVYVPTNQGYSLLLSAAQPEEFLQALRSSHE